MTVTFERKDQVAYVTIRRPERMNAIDSTAEAQLEKIWTEIEQDETLRCVVLTGEGEKAFCAGADMKSGNDAGGVDYWARSQVNGFGGLAYRDSLSIPVIARVNGFALGGGFEMLMGCDIVVATEYAKFGLPEAKVGRLPLEGGMVLLQRLIPEKIALGIMLSGRKLLAEDAKHYGFVNEVVPYDELDDAVARWVADIKSCAPLSIKAIKETVKKTAHLSPRDAQALRTPALIKALQSNDSDEGVKAFVEKRAPVWTGT
ncbi:enoyl-CoA hydratase-related protein [Sneathiella aquimaris]|uniref:enoyl-CoA hydratase-related protein n=1 Tax=Sneathiella aquimaris TaxID=2599305 RepID=UPI00146D2254|nr:enoyl-CoA hydratase-related protein [Sneathiella aquimaris]